MTDQNYKKVDEAIIEQLKSITNEKNIITDKEKMIDYSHDEYVMDEVWKTPEVVVKPETTEEIVEIVKLCNREKIPLTPRGGATGLCGACVPVYEGIVLSFENINKIIEIDTKNLTATVEPGLRLMDFYPALEEKGLFFPPHPGDESATIGGVIATNAGGSRAVKYGTVRNFVKGVEVVLPDGEIICPGGKFIKNSSGYSLLHLLIGSEGTLGIITKAIINLLPPPEVIYTLVAPYNSLHDAINTVPEIIRNKIMPMAIEFVGKTPIKIAEKFLDKKWPCSEGEAYLMIIIDGTGEDEIMNLAEKISDVCMNNNAIDIFVADNKQKQESILQIRSHIYEAIKNHMLEDLDISLPRAEIANYVDEVNKISQEHDIWISTYGHAADGNVHDHIMKSRWEDGEWKEIDKWQEKFPVVRKKLHELGKKYKGIVSGEHGIGLIKKEYLEYFLGKKQIDLMKEIKKIFEPDNILNPGKIFDL